MFHPGINHIFWKSTNGQLVSSYERFEHECHTLQKQKVITPGVASHAINGGDSR